MQRLIDRIQAEFRPDVLIEVYVLDNNGDPFELYSGLASGVKVHHLEVMLKEAGCFYVFSIVGIDRNLADSVDIQLDNIIRKEFCWLTDPSPPEVIERGSDKMLLQWKPISFCGINPGSIPDSIHYVLEVADGQEYRSGMSSRFVSDLNAMKYNTMCRGPSVFQAEVTELKPSTWYYWRIAIEYAIGSTRVQSSAKPVPTLRSMPAMPCKPRVYVIPGQKSFASESGFTDSKVSVTWANPCANGASIERYQLQLKEVEHPPLSSAELGGPSAESSVAGSWEERSSADSHGTGGAPHFMQTKLPGVIPQSRWVAVYCNLQLETILQAPRPEVMEWHLRVRAKNAEGWSDFSNIRVMNKFSHPSLFTSHNQYMIYMQDQAMLQAQAAAQHQAAVSRDHHANDKHKAHQTVSSPTSKPQQQHQHKPETVGMSGSPGKSSDSQDAEVAGYVENDIMFFDSCPNNAERSNHKDIKKVKKPRPLSGAAAKAAHRKATAEAARSAKVAKANQAKQKAAAAAAGSRRGSAKEGVTGSDGEGEELMLMSKSMGALGHGGSPTNKSKLGKTNNISAPKQSSSPVKTVAMSTGAPPTGMTGVASSNSSTFGGSNSGNMVGTGLYMDESAEDIFVRRELESLNMDIPVSRQMLSYVLEPTLRYLARQAEALDV